MSSPERRHHEARIRAKRRFFYGRDLRKTPRLGYGGGYSDTVKLLDVRLTAPSLAQGAQC